MESFPLYYTGLRSGDIIEAREGSKQNKGSIIKLEFNGGIYPPNKQAVTSLDELSFKNLIKYVKEASPYFKEYSDENIRRWLIENSTEYDDLYLSDTQDILISQKKKLLKVDVLFNYIPPDIKIENLGGTIFTVYVRDKFITNEKYALLDLYKAIPVKKTGTHARRHTLVFRPNIWKLKYKKLNIDYKGIIFNMDRMEYITKPYLNPGRIIVLPFGVGVNEDTPEFTPSLPQIETLFDIILTLIKDTNIEELTSIRQAMKTFSPSVHKSLIQKIIRRNTPTIIGFDKKWRAEAVLLVSFSMLLINPGAFVPDLQLYVSGLESAAKRLAVSINEDSYVEDANTLLSLYLGALISRPRGTWYPSLSIIKRWMVLALYAHKSNNEYMYELRKSHTPKSIYKPDNTYDACYLALKELKSFESDIRMLEQIAINGGKYLLPYRPILKLNGSPMHLVRAIDHHNNPDVLYMINPSIKEVKQYYGTITYAPIIKLLWDNVSGVNPRYGKNIDKHNKFVKEMTDAQWRWYNIHLKREKSKRQIIRGMDTTFSFEIEDSQLSGIIGSHEIRVGRKTLLVSLDPYDISNRVVIVRPTRNKQDFTISENERKRAIEIFNSLLETGIKSKLSKGLYSILNNMNIITQYSLKISFNNTFLLNGISWDKIKRTSIIYPVHPRLEWDDKYIALDAAIIMTGDGIEIDGLDIQPILLVTDTNILRRALNYLRGVKSIITMPSIGRDGYGTEYSVDPIDIAVFHFLIRLSIRIPMMLEVVSSKAFRVKNIIAMRNITLQIYEYIRSGSNKSIGSSTAAWTTVFSPRPLYSHQIEARDEILSRLQSSDVHMVDMPVGSGKTSIIADIIRILILDNKMPRYVVYSLPPSSYDNILREFALYKYNIIHLDPRKRKTSLSLTDYSIHLIHHDHMRHPNVLNLLRANAFNTFFVVDEFHLTLNPTQRTSIALELARVSNITITMSGTPIKDNRIDLLIPWLEMIVDFEVNANNFYVAMAAMIRRSINLNIKVNYEEVEAIMSRSEEDIYLKLLGPNVRAEPSNFRKAVNIAYDVCDKTMIRITKEYLNKNRLVFLIARNIQHQTRLRNLLIDSGLIKKEIFILSGKSSITYTPEIAKQSDVKVIITTLRHSTGYTLTAMSVLITSVYYSNEATRTQLVGRIVRIGQPFSSVDVITVHTGILSNIMNRYKEARNMSLALKSIAKEIGLNSINNLLD